MFKQAMLFIVLLVLITGCGNQNDQSDNNKPNTNSEEIPGNSETSPDVTDIPEPAPSPIPEPVEPDVKPEPVVYDEALYSVNQQNWKVEPIKDADKKVVLITIDDAPDKHSVEIAKQLKALDTPAIFFVNGHFLNTPEEEVMLKEIYDMGFAIGNHTYSHTALNRINEEQQRKEIVSLSDLVEKIIGERPVFFRAPHGINTDYSKQVVKEEGMVMMNWSYGYDWEPEYQNAEALADIMVNTPLLSSGANLLMHDRAWTLEAMPNIIKGLRDKGYEIVDPQTIEGLTESKDPTAADQP